jgi:hypothetical protein
MYNNYLTLLIVRYEISQAFMKAGVIIQNISVSSLLTYSPKMIQFKYVGYGFSWLHMFFGGIARMWDYGGA